ncbi:MAG: HD family phosphohydrolase [bacterium]
MKTSAKKDKKNLKEVKQSLKKFFKWVKEDVKHIANIWLRKENKNHALAIIFVFSLITAYLTIPSSVQVKYPTSIKDVGTVLNYSIRVNRDYVICDEEKTKQNRLMAEKIVPLFYIASETDSAAKNINVAFAHMRKSSKEYVANAITEKSLNIPSEFLQLAATSLPLLAKNQESTFPLKGEIASHFEKERDAFHKLIGFPVSSEVFTILSNNFFPLSIEKAVEGILSRLNTYLVLRKGIPEDYELHHISVKKREALISVPTSKIITDLTLKEEIKHTQLILQQNKEFSEVGREVIAELAFWILKDNISFSSSLTEENKLAAWNNAPKEEIKIKNGEIIKRAGEVLTNKDVMIFQEIGKQVSQQSVLRIYLQNLVYIAMLCLILFFAFKKSVSKFSSRNKDILLISVQAIVFLLIFKVLDKVDTSFADSIVNVDERIFYFLIPVPFAVATVRLLVNSETALYFLLLIAALFLLIFPDNFYFPVFYLLGSLFYMFLVTHIEKRVNIIKVSFFLSLMLMVLTVLIFAMNGTLPFDNLPKALMFSFIGAMLSGILIMGIISIYEWVFDYTTEITFLEYSSLNHPLMQKMAVQANGTYQHSLTLGSIVEVAAREVGLSPLTCKVMGYFHDIGKVERPEYFTENQTEKNVHDELPSHSMSAIVIMSHVKQGLEYAKKYHLGEKIEEAIAQHHGTTLVEFFYNQAKKEDKNVSESTYRYPGPKPSSKEAALIMIADSCEAAVRGMPEKNFQKISEKVARVIEKKISDGQLAECNITLKEVKKIETSIVKTLSGIYHARIEYPD